MGIGLRARTHGQGSRSEWGEKEMKANRETISITVRNIKVPVRTAMLELRYFTPVGPHTGMKCVVLYDHLLDREQERVLSEAKELVGRVGARLIVIDLAREGVVRRLMRRLAYWLSGTWSVAPSGTKGSSSFEVAHGGLIAGCSGCKMECRRMTAMGL
jgi:hypothetical protein